MLHDLRSVVCFSRLNSRKAPWEAVAETFYNMGTCLLVMCVLTTEGGAVPRPGERLGPQKQNLTIFGQWVDTLCSILSTTQPQIAMRANINESTVSRITRGERTPSPEIVRDLWEVFQTLAVERNISLSYYVETGFFNAEGSGYATSSQSGLSTSLLEMFKDEHGLGDKQEIERLKVQLQEKEARIQQLENRQNECS